MNPFAIALVQIAVSLIITAIAARMMSPDGVKAKKLDDFTFPTVDQDRSIPVVFGDVLVEGPNVTWFGDFKSKKIKEGGGLFSPDIVVGNKYFIGMEICIAWGSINKMTEIWFGDDVVWVGNVDSDEEEFDVNAQDIFGGEGEGGGVKAKCTFYQGTPDQQANTYIAGQIGSEYAHKGVSKLIWHGPSDDLLAGGKSGLVGESEIVPPIKMRVEHYPNFLATAYSIIQKTYNTGEEDEYTVRGANPAEVVYSLLIGRYANVQSTDPVVPVLPSNLIDTTTFTAAAQTLHTEGMGISFQWQRDTPVKDIIDDIMQHIDGYLSEDSISGKIRFTLNRQDYDPETVDTFDESNIVDFSSYVRINPTVAVNRMGATFTDPNQAFKQIPIMVEDLGNTFEQDMGAPGELDLHMFHSPDVVILRATRELVQLSEGIISGTFRANRDAYRLNIGEPIKLTWEGFGVDGLLVRVIEKRMGNLDDRTIEVKFVQDIFGIGTAIYGAPGNTAWQDIFNEPEDITVYEMQEQPHYFKLKYEAPDEHQLMLWAKFPTNDTFHYQVNIQQPGEDYVLSLEKREETESTTLVYEYAQENGPAYDTTAGLRVIGSPPEGWEGTATTTEVQDDFKHWIYVGGELMSFLTSTNNGDGSFTLKNVHRGLLDTTPLTHPVGERVWFLKDGIASLNTQFADNATINVKTQTQSSKGFLDFASAAAKSHTITNRDGKPFRPADVQINSGYYPEVITGDLDLSWAVRDRTNLNLVKWTDASETPEANQTTTLRIYNAVGTLIRTVADLTDLTYQYPLSLELADAGAVQEQLTIQLESARDAEVSHTYFSWTFNRIIGTDPEATIIMNLDTLGVQNDTDIAFDLDVPA